MPLAEEVFAVAGAEEEDKSVQVSGRRANSAAMPRSCSAVSGAPMLTCWPATMRGRGASRAGECNACPTLGVFTHIAYVPATLDALRERRGDVRG
jgi:hypothetical protein